MKTIKTTIATTLPDQVKSKFTKEALKGIRDQINDPETKFFVVDAGMKLKIGTVKKASIPDKDLVVTMKIDEKLIDKSFEWFFVPYGIPIDIKLEGEIEEISMVDLVCIQMVKMPTDLSLKPVRFEMVFVEGIDYFVKKYDELTPELVKEHIEKGSQVSVYYPESLGWDSIIKDAVEKGIVNGAEFVHPFAVFAPKISFEEFKRQIELSWENLASEKKMDPLLRSTELQ